MYNTIIINVSLSRGFLDTRRCQLDQAGLREKHLDPRSTSFEGECKTKRIFNI